MRLKTCLAAGLLTLLLQPSVAAEFDSAYTKIDLKKCPIIDKNDEEGPWALWQCRGYKGRKLFVAEGDLRFFHWLDDRNSQERLRNQTLPPFNTIGGANLEWRLKIGGNGGWQPFATIVRYKTSISTDGGPEKEGQVLVVSQIKRGASCHIAYIDALVNPNANQLARDAADTYAGSFDCNKDPMTIGKDGPSM